MSVIQWPNDSIVIIDAGDRVPMTTITMTYEDPGDPTKTAAVTLTRTPWLNTYIQGHPSHVDLPVDTFVVVLLTPENGTNFQLPVWVYGGRSTSYEAILDIDNNPVLDGDGYATYTVTASGRPGPDIGSSLFPFVATFNISATCALDSPWGARAVDVVFGANFAGAIEQPKKAWSGVVNWVIRHGVQWFGRLDPDGNPLSVPVNTYTLNRCDRLRHHLGGINRILGVDTYTQKKIEGARWNHDTRLMTYDSAPADINNFRGMYIGSSGGAEIKGYSPAENQIADIVPEGIILAQVPDQMGNNQQHAWFGSTEVTSCIAFVGDTGRGRLVAVNSTTGIEPDDEMRWGIYDEVTQTWSDGVDVVGVVDEVLDATSIRLREAATEWYGVMWAWDANYFDIGLATDEDIDIADDGYAGTPDGFTAVVS